MHVSQFGEGSPDSVVVVDLPDHHEVDVSFSTTSTPRS